MTEETIYSKLKTIISAYLPEDVSNDHINLHSDLTRELNINSSHLVDIVLDVEDAFDIALTNEDMEKIRSVADVVEIIQSKQQQP
jgi:acyl carrier protein